MKNVNIDGKSFTNVNYYIITTKRTALLARPFMNFLLLSPCSEYDMLIIQKQRKLPRANFACKIILFILLLSVPIFVASSTHHGSAMMGDPLTAMRYKMSPAVWHEMAQQQRCVKSSSLRIDLRLLTFQSSCLSNRIDSSSFSGVACSLLYVDAAYL